MAERLILAEDLIKHYPIHKGALIRSLLGSVRAVDGVSFNIDKGVGFGLVGESGCGKTTIAKLLLRVERPTGGSLLFRTKQIHSLRGDDLRDYRKSIQTVMQDPYSSLNPRMKVLEIVAEPLIVLGGRSRAEIDRRAVEMLVRVGLDAQVVRRYPHQFSGGQRQRIAIARALAPGPEVLILDEPTSSLDVSTRAQIMNLIKDLQVDLGLTVVIISHDLPIVRFISQQIAVMYLGEIVETGPAPSVYAEPLHPYTKALLAAVPTIGLSKGRPKLELRLSGEVPSAMNPPTGCRFHPRCPYAFDPCSVVVPQQREVRPGHKVACHLFDPTLTTARLYSEPSKDKPQSAFKEGGGA